jgi:hypothetical protein
MQTLLPPPTLQRTLFWDVNPDLVDWQTHARFVVERVVTRGSLEDWREIVRYYGWERLGAEVVKIRSLDRKTLAFCSAVFEIPKEQFKCTQNSDTMPSLRELWNV